MDFPKMNSNQTKGMSGQAYFEYLVYNQLNCIFHPVGQECDFGIDGYIELKKDDCATGKLVAVQIKHGDSFFYNITNYGYKFKGQNKHLNYYLNSNIPVFIIIMNDNFEKIYWVKFEISKVLPYGNQYWWIEIPKENILQSNFLDAIFNSTSPIVDYEEEIKRNWAINELLKEYPYRVLAIPKSDIDSNSFTFIKNFINKLTSNKELLIKSISSLDIFFPEYIEDSREIFQIPEIMSWLKNSIEVEIPWFYFLNNKCKNNGLHLLPHAYCNPMNISKVNKGYIVQFDNKSYSEYFEKNFINVNKFVYKYNIEEKYNEEISKGIGDYYYTFNLLT